MMNVNSAGEGLSAKTGPRREVCRQVNPHLRKMSMCVQQAKEKSIKPRQPPRQAEYGDAEQTRGPNIMTNAHDCICAFPRLRAV